MTELKNLHFGKELHRIVEEGRWRGVIESNEEFIESYLKLMGGNPDGKKKGIGHTSFYLNVKKPDISTSYIKGCHQILGIHPSEWFRSVWQEQKYDTMLSQIRALEIQLENANKELHELKKQLGDIEK